MNETRVCRWGILSAAAIAKKNWRAIALAGNSRLMAVAARQKSSAESFILECQGHTPVSHLPVAIEGYEQILERDDIDAVYIPLPTAIRAQWIRKALESGKHVLAEKPAGRDRMEVRELIDLAKAKGLQFMDGVMFMHSQRLPQMKAVLNNAERIGQLKRVAAHFSFCGNDDFFRSNIRSMSQFEPHGCLGDLGWYCIRLILWAKDYRLPKQVIGRTLTCIQGEGSFDQVPGEFSAELFYDDGFSASFYCSFMTENQQWAHFSGNKGYMKLDDFVLPFYGSSVDFESNQPLFAVDQCDFHMHDRTQHYACFEYSEGHATAQEVNMFRRFSDNVLRDDIEQSWGEITWKTQSVIDALFASANDGSSLKSL